MSSDVARVLVSALWVSAAMFAAFNVGYLLGMRREWAKSKKLIDGYSALCADAIASLQDASTRSDRLFKMAEELQQLVRTKLPVNTN